MISSFNCNIAIAFVSILPYLSKRIGHDSKTSFINALLGAKSLGTRGESIRFKIRKNINKSTAAKAKTTRFAIVVLQNGAFDNAE